METDEVQRLYWSTGQVGEILGIPASHVRFMVNSLGLPVAKRSKKGDRMFNRKEIERLRVVYGLTMYFHLSVVRDLINRGVDLDSVLRANMRLVYGEGLKEHAA